MRLLFAGTPEVACPTLTHLLDHTDHEVMAVLTRPDAPVGRHRTPHPSPVAALAQDLGIDVLKATSLRQGEVHDAIAALALDAAVVVAYGGLVPPDLLAVPRHGWVNLHFSLLPRWRGASPVQHAVMAGDEVTGACVFTLVPDLDAGPVHVSTTVTVSATTTAGDLLTDLAAGGGPLVAQALDRLAEGTPPTPQDGEGITLAPRLGPDVARLDPTAPGEEVDRLIRGLSPRPGAWLLDEGQRFKVLRSRQPEPDSAAGHEADLPALQPGQVHLAADGAVLMGTGTTPVELLEVQPSGKRAMSARDWARGARPEGRVLA